MLPAQLSFTQDADFPADEGGRRWRGNRYVDVLMDQEVEELLVSQGKAGEGKIELLQNRGYWGEYTVHPYRKLRTLRIG